MFEKVPSQPQLVDGEHDTLELWERTAAFEALVKKLAGGPRWSFLDGPITANNPMGVHHAWGRTYKDVFQRYFAMRGYDQRWQNGFDCQGLWVEVEVERAMGFQTKKDIEAFGLEKFIEACKERVLRFAEVITNQSIRLGMWMDWDNSYFTMSDENNYTIWSFLKKCHERGFIYKGLDSMPWCPRCGTGISEQERREGYERIEDESVYLRFPLRDRDGESLLVWTTTPWTLAANVAAAVHPDLTYSKVRAGEETLYLAESRLEVLEGDYQVLGSLGGSELEGWLYDGPFDELPAASEAVSAHRVILWDEVAADEGTGIVHIAPGCGKEDFQLGKELGLPVIAPIDDAGNYVEGFGFLTGKYASDVPQDVYQSLQAKGLFYKAERYVHDYPHCWRCQTPLLFRAVDEWYIDMSWRDEIAEVARSIRWIPEHGLDQELDWLRNMGDWMISKKRYWGLALPIWECESCGWFDVVGSREELEERAVEGWESFDGHTPHRPWVDAVRIRCGHCGKVASRIGDVGNPWLDAGIVPYSTVRYNEDREYWKKWTPADFVTESFPGQFRNWFYALLAMSTMMERIEPYKTLLGYALVRDQEGREFSASRYSIEFDEAADTMSADVMRWMYCRHTPTQNLNFGYGGGQEIERKVFNTLWNTYLFFTNYAILDRFDPKMDPIPVEDRPEIDRWLLSELQELIQIADRQFPDYWIAPFVRQAEEFVERLSNWYVRRNRPRFWSRRGEDEASKNAAYQTLYEVLLALTKLLAPLIPFLTERLYQNLVVAVDNQAPVSVHLTDYPVADPSLIDEELMRDMRVIVDLAAVGHSLRKRAGLRVRQPLQELRVAGDYAAAALDRLGDYLLEELNVKQVRVVDGMGDLADWRVQVDFARLGPRLGPQAQEVARRISQLSEEQVQRLRSGEIVTFEVSGEEVAVEPADVKLEAETAEGWLLDHGGQDSRYAQVALDLEPSEALTREGRARDVVRHIQNQRKELGLNIEDRINIRWSTESDELRQAIDEWAAYISTETQCDQFQEGSAPQGATVEVGIESHLLRLWIERAG